ncbi:zf-HC2 domain-containing protein [Knoellia locipacati]|uniref:zf-HC2 domain-containing protein n=1 Tax=Knoellia locipacati TaxID=882824 RepID=UPI00384F4677
MTQGQPRWHADGRLLTAYLEGSATAAVAASVEQHLVSCAQCRGGVADLSDPEPLRLVWDRVVAEVSTPAPSRVERLLCRLGLPDRDAVLIRSAPAVQGAWLLGILLCLLFAVIAAATGGRYGSLLFLWTAPLVPVLAVGTAFGPHADPSWELAVSSPSSPLRVILVRAGAVIATAVPLSALAGAVLPGSPWASVAWLLPSLAGVALTLALATWWPVAHAAASVGLTWSVVTGAVVADGHRSRFGETATDLLSASAAPAYVVIAVVAGVVFVHRADRLSHMGETA